MLHGAVYLAEDGANEEDPTVRKILARYAATGAIARIATEHSGWRPLR